MSELSKLSHEKTEIGGEAIVRTLVEAGIERAFCVPGESYMGILNGADTYKDQFDLVVCRHEGGASFMAEAHGRLSGKPGVCMVTRGPGASNAVIGVTTAQQENTPMILIIGHVTTGTAERFPFQGIDPKALFGGVSKWVGVIERTSDVPYMVQRAVRIAQSGRPGPVVLAVAEDVQMQDIPISTVPQMKRPGFSPAMDQIETFQQMLQAAKRPLVILGGNGWSEQTSKQMEKFAANYDLPVATTFRRNDYIDNASKHYIGSYGPVPHPGLMAYTKQSDLVILLGGRLSEIETAGYSQLAADDPNRKFIHAAPLVDEFGEVLAPDLAITTDADALSERLAELPLRNECPWSDKRAELRDSFLAYRKPVDFGELHNPAHAVIGLNEELPGDAIVTAGAGTYTHFILRHHQFKTPGTLLASLSGPMGYSVPSAIAAALEHPGREAVAYVGDGCFFMNPQELVVAAKRNLQVTVVMLNNGIYGSIQMHQEKHPKGRAVATTLDNPDFQELAKSLGLKSVQLTDPQEVGAAYAELRSKTKGPIFIELMTDPEVITTQSTLTQMRKG